MSSDIDPKYYCRNEYTAVKNHIDTKANNLWKHDNTTENNSASESRQTGFSLKNWKRWIIGDRVFWVLYDNTMGEAILTDWVDKALKSLPKIEEKRCICDILDALLKKDSE